MGFRMKIRFVFTLLLGVTIATLQVFPYPREVDAGTKTIKIPRCGLYFALHSVTDPAFHRVVDLHKELILGTQDSCSRSEHSFPIEIYSTAPSLDLLCKSEEYELEVTSEKMIVSANCSVGLIRAFATLYQIISKDDSEFVIENVPLKIKDSPRFQYRGLMIDSSRHFLPLPTLKRIVDAMSLAKMNMLHWHLVDDDSFTMQSKHIPGLAESAAFSKDQMYTIDQIKEFVKYAKDRGIDVMPEVDCPGHSRAIGKFEPLHPITTCFDRVWPFNLTGFYRIHGGPPTSALDPSMTTTYEYMENVMKDLIDYFGSEFIHLGGDEVVQSCWKERKEIDDFMKQHGLKDYDQLMSYFIKRIRDIITRLSSNKKTVYWSNPQTFNVKYGAGDILQYWGPVERINELTKLYPQNKFILSPTNMLYVSSGFGNRYGLEAGGYKTWLEIYLFEPTGHGLSESLIIGAEACAWGEMADEANLEVKLWPRVLGLAETLWSPKREKQIDLVDVVKRMNTLVGKLRDAGIPCGPVTSQFCEIHTAECFQKY